MGQIPCSTERILVSNNSDYYYYLLLLLLGYDDKENVLPAIGYTTHTATTTAVGTEHAGLVSIFV